MYELHGKIVEIDLGKLRENPRNKGIHGEFEPNGRDAWLVEDVRKNGILTPLIIDGEGNIDDGHRRKLAAKIAGRKRVPCMVLPEGDREEVFRSAQLGRNLSLYAKCILYRDSIQAVMDASKKKQEAQLSQNDVCDEDIEAEWDRLVQVLGVNRRSLQGGLSLLNRLDGMRSDGTPHEANKADRVEGIFRERGLKPAKRMLDPEPEKGEESEVEDVSPDCNEWSEGNEDYEPQRNREAVTAAVRPAVECSNKQAKWRDDAYRLLGQLESHLKSSDMFNDSIQEAMNKLEDLIHATTDAEEDE